MNSYTRYALQRGAFAWIQRMMLDYVIDSDTPAKHTEAVEELPKAESVITQEIWQETYQVIQLLENDRRLRMSRFRWLEDPSLSGDIAVLDVIDKKYLEKKKAEEEKKDANGAQGQEVQPQEGPAKGRRGKRRPDKGSPQQS